ncbi:MAG: GxxExxY protein [Magnetospirillum sp.]|nr:GxxExxY protein [Magnetospirillum sp.]
MAEQADTLHTLGGVIVDSALKVHKELGPGLLESVYEHCLAHELSKRGIHVKRQAAVPIQYDGESLDAGLRLDLLVNDMIVVEIKAVEKVIPVHAAQLLTYLKLSGKRMGFLINFNVRLLKEGIRRYVL